MITIDCVQGTPEWFQARLGIPTASNFNKIITPGRLEPSKSADTYINQLIAEWLTGKPDESFQSEWMTRGHELEEEARDYYAFQTNSKVTEVGFCLDNAKQYGCSPDGFVGDAGGFEVKCPSPGVHTGYLMAQKVPTIYKVQILGGLLVTSLKWWDFMSYHPDIEPLIVRTYRKDVEGDLRILEKALIATNKKIYDKKQTLIKRGLENAPF